MNPTWQEMTRAQQQEAARAEHARVYGTRPSGGQWQPRRERAA